MAFQVLDILTYCLNTKSLTITRCSQFWHLFGVLFPAIRCQMQFPHLVSFQLLYCRCCLHCTYRFKVKAGNFEWAYRKSDVQTPDNNKLEVLLLHGIGSSSYCYRSEQGLLPYHRAEPNQCLHFKQCVVATHIDSGCKLSVAKSCEAAAEQSPSRKSRVSVCHPINTEGNHIVAMCFCCALRNTLGLLGADGYVGYAPDWLGHGDSQKPSTSQFDYSEEAFIKQLDAFVEAVGIKQPFALIVQVTQ